MSAASKVRGPGFISGATAKGPKVSELYASTKRRRLFSAESTLDAPFCADSGSTAVPSCAANAGAIDTDAGTVAPCSMTPTAQRVSLRIKSEQSPPPLTHSKPMKVAAGRKRKAPLPKADVAARAPRRTKKGLVKVEVEAVPSERPAPLSWVGDAQQSFVLPVAGDFLLAQAVCSYGFYILSPNQWSGTKPGTGDGSVFSRPLSYGPQLEHVVLCRVREGPRTDEASRLPQKSLVVELSKRLIPAHQDQIRKQVQRMLRTDLDLAPWFALNSEARERGFGRLFRSPTLFEDMIKTITNCNVNWKGTCKMNRLLCQEFGSEGAFPTCHQLAAASVEDIKERVKVGYRAERIQRLARMFRDGEVDVAWLDDPRTPREEAFKYVRALYGFGDFAAYNVLQLIGHFEAFPFDSETVRHFREVHGVHGKDVKEITARAKRHYDQYHPYQFVAYWYELWKGYEQKTGVTSVDWTLDISENLSK